MDWQPYSWRDKSAQQQPVYENVADLNQVTSKLSQLPPLVFTKEIEALKQQIALASRGERFLLQGGDCAEAFSDCRKQAITSKLKILLQMSLILCYGARRPVIRIGRIAGQYGKPRSKPTESVDGVELPVFRGENVNSIEADQIKRQPDPKRLLEGYYRSALTLNYIRALTKGGFADLHYPEHWDLQAFAASQQAEDYHKLTSQIKDAIAFMDSLGASDRGLLKSVEFYTSHEGLLLEYESAVTKKDDAAAVYYNLGAHMLWIGDRTRQLDGAHIEYFRGIANPIGIKVGPSADPQEMVDIVKALNPGNEAGRIVLITRFGAQHVRKHLPRFIERFKSESLQFCWSVDPMHGNTVQSRSGLKTRNFSDICDELQATFELHRQLDSVLGGVHFELTGENVTECKGGSEGITDEDLVNQYRTTCDPRLNYSQSLEMAFLISKMLQ